MSEPQKLLRARLLEGQAEGAIPNGTRIYKCNSESDEPHQDGSCGVVVGSILAPKGPRAGQLYLYSVFWDDMAIPMTITADQITSTAPDALTSFARSLKGRTISVGEANLGCCDSPRLSHSKDAEGIYPNGTHCLNCGWDLSKHKETASQSDREWFERHPNETERIREAIPGEFPPKAFGDATHVLVTQIAPGIRQRKPITVIPKFDPERRNMKQEPVVKIYKDQTKNGNGAFALSTTASDPDEFLRECSLELELVSTELVGDLEFTYNALLPQICEVWAKLRGYKADSVYEHKILVIGEPHPEAHMTLLNSRSPVPAGEA